MKKPRCAECNKKLGLVDFKCKCSNTYCMKCKMPEDHKCSFDYKKESKEILTNKLEKIENEKVIKIF